MSLQFLLDAQKQTVYMACVELILLYTPISKWGKSYIYSTGQLYLIYVQFQFKIVFIVFPHITIHLANAEEGIKTGIL